jgi:hypothetical protein
VPHEPQLTRPGFLGELLAYAVDNPELEGIEHQQRGEDGRQCEHGTQRQPPFMAIVANGQVDAQNVVLREHQFANTDLAGLVALDASAVNFACTKPNRSSRCRSWLATTSAVSSSSLNWTRIRITLSAFS